MSEIFSILNEGGIFMYGILATSLVAVAVMLQRFYALWFQFRLNAPQLQQRVLGYVAQGEYGKALQLTAGQHPLQRLLNSALMRANRSEKEIRRAVEATSVHELARFRGQTSALPQLSNLATLLGLLGTIHGLIISFKGMQGADAAARSAGLSKGVAVAFYNTFFGLTVAVVVVIAFLIISTKQNGALNKMESALAQVIDHLVSPTQAKRARSSSEMAGLEAET